MILAEELDSLLDSKILRSCKKKKKKKEKEKICRMATTWSKFSISLHAFINFLVAIRMKLCECFYQNRLSFIWNEIKRSRGKQWLMYVCLTKKLDCYVNFGIWDVQVLIFKEEFWLFKSFWKLQEIFVPILCPMRLPLIIQSFCTIIFLSILKKIQRNVMASMAIL